MDKARALWGFIEKGLARGERFMVLLVTNSTGSSPGRTGFKMAVAADGTLHGSIGGGVMEVKMVEWAKSLLAQSATTALLKRQIHRKSATRAQSGMICSGEQTVLLFPLSPSDLKTVRRLLRFLKTPRPATCVWTQQHEKPTFDVRASDGFSGLPVFEQQSARQFRYAEALALPPRLYIVGAGHCALALSELAVKTGFYCCLLDDRPDLNTFHQNHFVQERHLLAHYGQVQDFIPAAPDVYVVVMTLGYRSDAEVLRGLLHRELRYLAMLGSAAKVATLIAELSNEGYPPEALARVCAPAGVPIHSQTPEEIAVSIVAELILVKNTGSAWARKVG